jgi:hypothetical protein
MPVPSSSGRIKRESEPPNLATEIKATDRSNCTANPPSPVRMRDTQVAKAPRNRAFFSVELWMLAGSLCNARLNGGEGGIRTCSTRLPVLSAGSAPPFEGLLTGRTL